MFWTSADSWEAEHIDLLQKRTGYKHPQPFSCLFLITFFEFWFEIPLHSYKFCQLFFFLFCLGCNWSIFSWWFILYFLSFLTHGLGCQFRPVCFPSHVCPSWVSISFCVCSVSLQTCPPSPDPQSQHTDAYSLSLWQLPVPVFLLNPTPAASRFLWWDCFKIQERLSPSWLETH